MAVIRNIGTDISNDRFGLNLKEDNLIKASQNDKVSYHGD